MIHSIERERMYGTHHKDIYASFMWVAFELAFPESSPLKVLHVGVSWDIKENTTPSLLPSILVSVPL